MEKIDAISIASFFNIILGWVLIAKKCGASAMMVLLQ